MKKLLILTLTLLMLMSLCLCPASALEQNSLVSSALNVKPGNVRWDDVTYNYAWFDNMVIRDDAMAATQAHIIPKPTDYPYRITYENFLVEAADYTSMVTFDEESIAPIYNEIINSMYYVVVAMGMTDELDVMKQYLTEQGIRLPANSSAGEKAQVAVVYAAMKFDAVYVLYGKKVSFPVGTTLDGAIVTILSALMGVEVPSGTDNISGFILLCTKNYVTSFEDIPISDDPSEEEILHWTKLIVAASSGDYQVPVEVYSETTAAQREYVDYAYFASILSDVYDVKIDPVKLAVALQSSDSYAVQKLILNTMLDEKEVDYPNDLTMRELFDMACQKGCFNLEEEFYTDVLKYDIEVAQNCEKIWFTSFPIAALLEGGSDDYLKINLAGSPVSPSATTGIALDPDKATETVVMEVIYDAPDRQDTAVYEFNIIKNAALNTERNPETQNDMVAEVEKYVNTIVPTDSEKAQQIIGSIFQGVDAEMQNNKNTSQDEGILTTYGEVELSVPVTAPSSGSTSGSEGYDFNYLDELIGGMYETDENGNIITTTAFYNDQYTTEKQSIIEKTVETVKEKPEIVVAPTGLIAVGAFAGYLMTKKHRDSEVYLESENTGDEETEN